MRSPTSFSVRFWALLLCFFIAFILIKPEGATGKIDTKAEFMVTVT